jgi:hypothetical protein
MHSQKGSVLVLVTFICAAVLFFTTFLLDLNSLDVRIAANQRDGLQAYYLALTGLEVIFAVLEGNDPFYQGNENISFAGGNINLKVGATEGSGGGRRVQIVSTGRSGLITEQIVVEFQSFPASSGSADAAGLDWYDGESGVITPGYHEAEGTISLGGSKLPSLSLGGGGGRGTIFSAEQIIFKSNLTIEGELEMRTETLILQKNVHLCSHGGSLLLLNPSGDPLYVYLRGEVTVPGGPLLGPGVYRLPSGTEIRGDPTMPDLQHYRILPAVPGTIVFRKGIPT